MANHSNLMGGSSAEKRIQCIGSYQQELPLPEQPESDYAKQGSCLHEAIEHYLKEVSPEPTTNLLGMKFYGIEITKDLLRDKIDPALDAFDEIIDDYLGGDLDFTLEPEVHYPDHIMKGAFGSIDVLGRGVNGVRLVLDWKFGDGVPVSPEGSYQCGFYGGAAMYDDKVADIFWGDTDENTTVDILFAIVQPRRGQGDEPTYSTWLTNTDWVEDFIDTAAEAFEKMQAPEAATQLKEGSWCRWCAANIEGVCPIKTQAVRKFDTKVQPSMMDPVTLGAALKRADEIEETIKNIRKFAQAELERGVKIPGVKLVKKRASRKWKNEDLAEQALREMKVKVGDFTNSTLKSPPQLEKVISKEKYRQIAAEHVIMESSGTTMVDESDNRPEVDAAPNALAAKAKALGIDPTETKN